MVAAENHQTGQGAPPELRMCRRAALPARYMIGVMAR
jgi:hypothetical protein